MAWSKRFFLRINTLAWAPDGACLAVGLARGVALLDATTGERIGALATDEARALAWAPDGASLAEGGQDGVIRLWDIRARTVSATGAFHSAPVIALRWSPHGALLLSASSVSVHLWDTTSNTTRWQSTGASAYPVQVAWAPNGERFAFADRQYHVQVRAAPGEPLLATYRGHEVGYRAPAVNPVAALSWSPDGQWIASQGLDGVIHIWDAEIAATLQRIPGADGWGYFLEWSPDSAWLAGRETPTSVCLWDATTGQPGRRYQTGGKPIIAIAWSPDSSGIATASADHRLQVG
jgi:WD40 repeat protein